MSREFGDLNKFPGDLDDYAPPRPEDESFDSWSDRVKAAWVIYLGLAIAFVLLLMIVGVSFYYPSIYAYVLCFALFVLNIGLLQWLGFFRSRRRTSPTTPK